MSEKIYEVKTPDGSVIKVKAPENATEEQIFSFAQSHVQEKEAPAPQGPDYGEMGVGGVALSALKNIPSSAGQFLSDITAPIHSPVQTAKAIGSLAVGLVQKMTPGIQADEAIVDAVGKFYADRYGSIDGFKKAVATDPVGILSDVSMIFTGGGAAAAKAPGMIGKAGRIANKVGRVADPAALAVKGLLAAPKVAGKTAKNVVGLMSGVGDAPISEAFNAGFKGGDSLDALIKNMRTPEDYMSIVDDAKSALGQMRQDKSAAYAAGMVDIAQDATILDLGDVQRALNKAFHENTFKGKFKNSDVQKALTAAQDEITEWAKLDPAEYHTPEGMDALKQKVGGLIDFDAKSQAENRALQGVYNEIKGAISKQAPKYAEVMSDYATAAEEIKGIEKALSLNDKASADTALRKLTSVMRNNVNTNYGQRSVMAESLQTASGKPIMPSIAGQALSSFTPRGLAGTAAQLAMTGMAGSALSPWALLTAPLQSPRIVGEAAQMMGQASRPISNAAKAAAPFVGPVYKSAAPYSPLLGYGALQSGRVEEQAAPYLLRTPK